jgi:hypothetical protein
MLKFFNWFKKKNVVEDTKLAVLDAQAGTVRDVDANGKTKVQGNILHIEPAEFASYFPKMVSEKEMFEFVERRWQMRFVAIEVIGKRTIWKKDS